MAVISVNWSLASGAWYKLKGTSENDIMSSDGIYPYNDSDHYLLFYGYGGNDTITNSDSHDKSGIYGGAGADSILNHSTDVTIDGGADNDTIGSYGGKSSKIDGGSGNDYILNTWHNENNTSSDDSTLIGGSGDDSIYNYGGDRVSISGGDGNDTIGSYGGENSKIDGGAGDDSIENLWRSEDDTTGDKSTLTGGEGNDYIGSCGGKNVSIDGGVGKDYISNYFGYGVTIDGGAGNDDIVNDGSNVLFKYTAGDGNDTITRFFSNSTLSVSGGSYSTTASNNDILVKVGNGTIRLKNVYATADTININGKSTALERKVIKLTKTNNDIDIFRDSLSVVGSSSNDDIYNSGFSVTIDGGAGDDYILNYADGSQSTINGGKGNDSIRNNGSQVTINGSTGNDTIYNGCYREYDDSIIYYYDDDIASNVLFKYKAGDGNDLIYGFNETSTLSIGGSSYSTKKSGSDIIVTVGKGKITLDGAASLDKVNIKKNTSGGGSSTKLTITNSTKSPVTVGSAIKTINASSRTKAVKITGNKLDNTITGGSGKDSIYGGSGNDSILGGKGNDKLYGQAGNDTFIYAKGDGKDIIYGFANDDMLKITGAFSAFYNKSKKEIYFTVGSTSNVITLKDFGSTSTFNVNGKNYKISGTKLVKDK